jgi:hypothetical protein
MASGSRRNRKSSSRADGEVSAKISAYENRTLHNPFGDNQDPDRKTKTRFRPDKRLSDRLVLIGVTSLACFGAFKVTDTSPIKLANNAINAANNTGTDHCEGDLEKQRNNLVDKLSRNREVAAEVLASKDLRNKSDVYVYVKSDAFQNGPELINPIQLTCQKNPDKKRYIGFISVDTLSTDEVDSDNARVASVSGGNNSIETVAMTLHVPGDDKPVRARAGLLGEAGLVYATSGLVLAGSE